MLEKEPGRRVKKNKGSLTDKKPLTENQWDRNRSRKAGKRHESCRKIQ